MSEFQKSQKEIDEKKRIPWSVVIIAAFIIGTVIALVIRNIDKY